MQGLMELERRTTGSGRHDVDAPQFFSLAASVRSARLQVHWFRAIQTSGEVTYHMQELRLYDLWSQDDVASLRRAVLNIYDWARKDHFKRIFTLLNILVER
jgi:hypothetical protein